MKEMKQTTSRDLFVYGTLLNRYFVADLLGHPVTTYSEVLDNYKKVGLNIIESEGDEVNGVIFEINKEDQKILDRYEGVESNYYKLIPVKLRSGREAFAYQMT